MPRRHADDAARDLDAVAAVGVRQQPDHDPPPPRQDRFNAVAVDGDEATGGGCDEELDTNAGYADLARHGPTHPPATRR